MATVDVVMPVLNEADTIEQTLESITDQTHPPDCIWVADGGSHDGTRMILDEWTNRLPIRVLKNPKKRQAPGLNRMIQASDADYLARMNGHFAWSKEYLERLVDILEEDLKRVAAGGLVVCASPTNRFQKNVWTFMTHFLGTGAPAYRTDVPQSGTVETVQSPVYRRKALVEVGGFREDTPWAEDDELHSRLRKRGGELWLEPRTKIRYIPRNSYRGFFTQINHYGQGRGRLGRHGAFPTKRHRVIDRLLLIWTFGMVWNPIGWGLGLFYSLLLPFIVLREWSEGRGGGALFLLFPGGQICYWLGWLKGRFSPLKGSRQAA